MDVTRLIDELSGRFPSFNRSWERDYRAALEAHAGPALEAAWHRTMTSWRKVSWPRPADILAHIPAKSAPVQAHGLPYAERMAQDDEKRRDRAREVAEMGMRDFRERYGQQPWEWHVWWRVRDLADLYAQAEILRANDRLSDTGFAKYRYKLTDEEIGIARKCWESQQGGKNNLPFREPVAMEA